MPVEFDKTVEEATFYSPMADFERDTQPVEYRTDPLTGQQSRVVVEWFPDPPEDPAVDDFVGDGEGCFFCPETVTDATPEYPDFVGVDRGSVGEATSFPNLFPYAEHSNVVVLTEDHFRPASDLTADLLADAARPVLYVGGGARRSEGGPEAVRSLADRLDASRHVQSPNAVLWGAEPGHQAHDVGIAPHQVPVGRIGAGRVHPHQHLARPDRRPRGLSVFQDVGRTVLVLHDRPHRIPPAGSGGRRSLTLGEHRTGNSLLVMIRMAVFGPDRSRNAAGT